MITPRRPDHLSLGALLLFGGFYLQAYTILYPGKTDNEEKETENCTQGIIIIMKHDITLSQLKSVFQHTRLTSLRSKEYAKDLLLGP